uniref:Odorant receptor n=1 Tax=Lutzomyia longipalpis TaxID=7200 RepID=A0A3F2ZDF7_LUTLO
MTQKERFVIFEKMVRVLEVSHQLILFTWAKKLNWKFRFFVLIPIIIITAAVLTSFAKMFHADGDKMVFAVAGIFTLGYSQMLLSGIFLMLNEGKINNIFTWLRQMHQEHEDEIVSPIYEDNLVKIEKLAYLFMRVLLCITTTTCVVINSYVHIREKFILGIPYVLEDYVHLQGFIANFFLFYGSLYLTLIEATIIFIGVYFIATLGILSDLIKLLSETTESTGKILKLIVRLQVKIIENFNDYCEALFYVFLIQISTCVFLLVLLFFLLMHTITNAMYLVIIVTVMSQFAMFCFFGQIIHNRSERIFTDLYITKWYEMDVKDQKALLLAMKMSQRTLGFKVAGMYDINFVMFVQMIKLCFSYCTILYSIITEMII